MRNIRYNKPSSKIAKRRKTKETFSFILKTGLPIAILVGLVLLLRADFLQVKTFEVLGAQKIYDEEIKNLAQSLTLGNKFLLVPKTNLFFINKEKLATALLSQFNRLEKVEINKQFFSHKVEFRITERKDKFLWCSADNKCFFMTEEGLVFVSSTEAETGEKADTTRKLIFKGRLGGDPLMKSFATPAEIQNFLKLVLGLETLGFEVSSINIESGDRAIAKTQINNYTSDVIFNPTETNLSSVAQNVILLINETITKDPGAHFDYIDARFGNKIFYKLI